MINLTPEEQELADRLDANHPLLEDSRIRYFDRDGDPMTFGEWVAVYEFRKDYRRINETNLGWTNVSTVWLGLDHRVRIVDHPEPPLIFETMVFGGPNDQEMWRYSTEEEARIHHDQVVAVMILEGRHPKR